MTCYSPYKQNLSGGEIILWQNIDSTAHTVTSGSPDKGKSNYFDSKIIAPQNNFSHKFDDSGSFSYFCELHPWMTGLVFVNNSQVPSWIKNNAGWWADGTLSDNDFLECVEWLVSNEIISIE